MTRPSEVIATGGAIIVSVLVLGGFLAVSVLLFTKSIPPESKEIALMLLGGLNSMASGVVGYWVGSSIGSRNKERLLTERQP